MPPAPVRTLVAALVALPLFLLVSPPPAIADSPRCATASALTEAGKPQEAAELIDKIRVETEVDTACSVAVDGDDVATEAVRRIEDAQVKAQEAATAAKDSVVNWQSVADTAQDALDLDEDNAQATVLLATAEKKVQAQNTEGSPAVAIENRSSDWADLIDGSLADLGKLALLALAVMAAILLLARLLLLLPQTIGRIQFGPPRRLSSGLFALPVTTAAAVAVASLAPSASVRDSCVLAAGVGAATLIAWSWLFHRPRVKIEMLAKGKADEGGAAAVVAHVRNLGARPPAGLEIPRGADAETLRGSNIATASLTGVLGSLVGVLQSALSVTPWQVLVDRDTDDQTVVVVSLHGRVRDTAVIQHAMFGPDGPRVDPLKLASACVLMTILKARKTYEGLGGATVWLSIGLQYDATVGDRPKEERLQMLARAVDLDPGNWPARMSWRVERSRDSADSAELRVLAHWLSEASSDEKLADETTLRGRLRYNSYVAYLNHVAALGGGDCKCEEGGLGQRLNRELQDSLGELQDGDLKRRMESNVEALNGKPISSTDFTRELKMTPSRAYIHACYWAKGRSVMERERALEALRFAFNDDRYREAAKTDPMLKRLREHPDYRKAFPADPRTALIDIAPFDGHATALKASGLTEPGPLGRTSVSRLAAILSADVAVAREIQQRALLVLAVDSDLEDYRLEIVEVAVARGITTVADLREGDLDREALRKAIMAACKKRGLADPDAAKVQAWLDRFVTVPSPV